VKGKRWEEDARWRRPKKKRLKPQKELSEPAADQIKKKQGEAS